MITCFVLCWEIDSGPRNTPLIRIELVDPKTLASEEKMKNYNLWLEHQKIGIVVNTTHVL